MYAVPDAACVTDNGNDLRRLLKGWLQRQGEQPFLSSEEFDSQPLLHLLSACTTITEHDAVNNRLYRSRLTVTPLGGASGRRFTRGDEKKSVPVASEMQRFTVGIWRRGAGGGALL